MEQDKEGKYCTICGGMPSESIKIRRILIEGKETGIDRIDEIIEEVIALGLGDERRIREELLRRVMKFNYIPEKKKEAYMDALFLEFRKVKMGQGGE